MNRSLNAVLPIVLVLATRCVHAQQNDLPLNRDVYYDLDRNHACLTSTVHTAMRPYIESRADLTGVMGHRPDTNRYYYDVEKYLFERHLFEVREGDLRIHLDPVFQFDMGFDFAALYVDSTYGSTRYNGRGIRIAADLGPRLSVQTTFYENQADLPTYLYLYSNETGAVPGQGRVKTLDRTTMDFAWATGNVSYTPWRWLNLQFGNGRLFVGDGYRSLMLSDNASPHPYFKASVLAPSGRWQYTTITSKLEMFERLPTGSSSESLFYWKRGTFHHASVNLGRAQLGFFESTLWRTIDSSGVEPFNAWQVNPLPLLNTFVGAREGIDNQLLGVHGKLKLTDKAYLYGQYVLDPTAAGRNGWQAGLQWFDLLRRDIHFLVEYNNASPFLYTANDADMNMVHMGHPMAHPMGTHFGELVAIADMRIRNRWAFQAKVNRAITHQDRSDTLSYGSSIFKPGIEGPAGPQSEPVALTRTYVDLSASFLMNHVTNMRVTLGWSYRDVTPYPTNQNASHLYLGFRTGLFNRYYDI